MKYDYIYSEAVEIITAKKDDGTKFFSKDTLCVAVTEDDKLYSAFNKTEYVEGRLITGSSEKEVVKKISGSENKRIAAMIIMNCIDMVPVLPEKEEIEEIMKLDKYNAATDVVSPNNKYIKLKDISEYDPEGDNSSIEILKVDITAKRSEKEKLLSFVPDFEKETDEGGKSETKYLFAMPDHNADNNAAQPPQSPEQNMQQGQTPYFTMDDVVHQYQPVDGRHRGMNVSRMSMNRSQMSVQFSQNTSQVMNPDMMNGPQSVMMGQYGVPNQQNGVPGQYGNPNQNMMGGTYGGQNMMNVPYMQQGMMNGQYNGQMMNGPYMQQGMMNSQYSGQMMNGPYMQQGMMNSQYSGQMVNGPYMQQGMMNGQYNGQMMNGPYMQQGMMNGQYNGQMMNGPYMHQGMMNGAYMQQQEEMNPQYMQQNMNDGKQK
ncbi:hypothetical protein [Ruminococcus sp. HUN007]|uniref:hypothetical protein n=1 Tax=Ruminococcus sp. HUN007 TaxID=1514668 RepID=UPI0005D2D242|nr:hypothetical protein [Ruminococcus sp. HUN007]